MKHILKYINLNKQGKPYRWSNRHDLLCGKQQLRDVKSP